jgi:hypothetical protein
MLEKRSKAVTSRKVTANDLRELARLIQDEYARLREVHQEAINSGRITKYASGPRLRTRVMTKDTVEYSSDSMEPFEKGGILDTKVVTECSISLIYEAQQASVSARIVDSQSSPIKSLIEVEGNDRTWVSGTFSRLLDCANSWEKQGSVFKRYRWPISFFAALFIALSLGWLLTIPLRGTEKANDAVPGIFAIIFGAAGMPVFFFLADFLDKLWPDIEIVPVPEHERRLDKRRKYLWGVISLILIPVVIAIVQWLVSKA